MTGKENPFGEKPFGLARQVRELIRGAVTGAIATIDRDTGEPYVALTVLATDHDVTPILLLSELSDHRQNLDRDNRASLLLDRARGLEHPMTGARVSLQGRLEASDRPDHRDRYLARHPAAAQYADFADFGIFRLNLTRVHLIGGFGVAKWLEAAAVSFDVSAAESLRDGETAILEHMNADHGEAVQLYAKSYGAEGGGWQMTGIDPEGCDLRRDGEVLRIAFESPIQSPDEARETLVKLAQEARRPG